MQPASPSSLDWLPEPLGTLPLWQGLPRSASPRRTRALLASLGHPERAYAVVHVAGTNGKGSTAFFLAHILRAAGRRTGLYTSPHLVSPNERIRVDLEPLGRPALEALLPALGPPLAESPVTAFEALTVAALAAFRREGVATAVVEAGVGGLEDATNALERPAATILTNVGLDHQDRLGPTLADVARHNAGILRPGVPAFVGPLPPEAASVVARAAAAVGAPLVRLGVDLPPPRLAAPPDTWWLPGGVGVVRLRPLGAHQADNAALAAAAALHLGLPLAAIRAGLAETTIPGRLDVRTHARAVVDGAHNVEATRRLAAALRLVFPGERFTVVFGSTRRHAAAILAPLLPLARRVFLVPVTAEGAAPEELAAALRGAGPLHVFPDLDAALAARPPDTWLLVTGSLYLAADALRRLA